MEKIINIQNLSKSFKDVKAVNHISFEVKRGELFAFLGVNGAGKSTTISMLCGQLKKDSGTIEICQKNMDAHMDEILSVIGVVFQESALDSCLNAYDNLKSRAALYGITGKEFKERLDELAELLEFKEYMKRPLSKLSGGQKRRIDIARALFHRPKILILDEPTTGLDPYTRKRIWEIIEQLRQKEQLTVFLTTHYMEEAGNADYVVILDRGNIVCSGTPYELKNRFVKDMLFIYGVDEKDIQQLNLPYKPIRNGYRLEVDNPSMVTQMIIEHPSLFMDYEMVKGGMDDVFLAVTGKNLKGESQ